MGKSDPVVYYTAYTRISCANKRVVLNNSEKYMEGELRSPAAAPNYHPQRKPKTAPRRVQRDDRRLRNVVTGRPDEHKSVATRKQQTSVGPAVIKSRFPDDSENVPAPNAYHLPSTDAYKYRRTARVTVRPRRPAIAGDDTPPPNAYSSPVVANPAKTFGQKANDKRIVYMTVEDFAY